MHTLQYDAPVDDRVRSRRAAMRHFHLQAVADRPTPPSGSRARRGLPRLGRSWRIFGGEARA